MNLWDCCKLLVLQQSHLHFWSQYDDWKKWNEKTGIHKSGFRFFGRSVGIRTRGLLDPNQARYQTSPHLVSLAIIMKKPGSVKP